MLRYHVVIKATLQILMLAAFTSSFSTHPFSTHRNPEQYKTNRRHLFPQQGDTNTKIKQYIGTNDESSGSQNDPLSNKNSNLMLGRRQTLKNLATGALLSTNLSFLQPIYTNAMEETNTVEENIEVYFGCGCFWHVQHEFVMAEKNLLNRKDMEITARAGYAGGGNQGIGRKDEKVCYHNAAQIADYGSLGHAEVVRLSIPPSSFPSFAQEYFALFDDKGDRPDQFGDRGGEYRNLVGVPGGVKSKYAQMLVDASMKAGDKLDFAKGKGNDPDARALAFVMDSNDFPFYVAEQYHQFHDGFNIGENYPGSYNGLAGALAKDGALGTSQCPNGLLGLGALGL